MMKDIEKTLSIVVIHDKRMGDIGPLLASINNSIGVNFEEIEVIRMFNGGPATGATCMPWATCMPLHIRTEYSHGIRSDLRRRGAEVARGKYVMFCDGWDVLHSVGSVGAIVQEAKKGESDLILSTWLEEIEVPTGDGDDVVMNYATHVNDTAFTHGVAYRREFLEEHGLEKLFGAFPHHGATAVNTAAVGCDAKTTTIESVSYVWRYHTDERFRIGGGEFRYSGIPEHIDAYALGLATARENGASPDVLGAMALRLIVDMGLLGSRCDWDGTEHIEHCANMVDALRELAKANVSSDQRELVRDPSVLRRVLEEELPRYPDARIRTVKDLIPWVKRICFPKTAPLDLMNSVCPSGTVSGSGIVIRKENET